MPELYPGQTQAVTAKLEQARLLQSADADELEITQFMDNRAAIQRRMAGRVGLIAGYERQLRICAAEDGESGTESPESKTEALRFRVTSAEKAKLHAMAEEQGVGVSEYVRMMCGL
jgi:hypothetical protein